MKIKLKSTNISEEILIDRIREVFNLSKNGRISTHKLVDKLETLIQEVYKDDQ